MKTKSKLMAALVMLLVSAIMMSTASFAWFTISTAPEISNMKSTVAANGNLEIALDAGYTSGENVPDAVNAQGTVTANDTAK